MDSNINSSDGVENSGTQTAGVEFTRVALQRIRQRLLDLTRRNRLLNYKEGAKTIVIRDELPDVIFQKLLNGESLSFSYVKEGETNQLSMIGIAGDQPAENSADADLPVIVGRTSVNTVYHDDDLQTIHSQEVLDRRLLALYRDHKTIIEETGGNDLHLVIGLLEFPERGDPDTLFRAPLILVPVHLERVGSGGHGGRIRFVLKYSDETTETNHSLAEKLRMDFGIELPELPEEVVPDNYFCQVEASIRELRDKGWRVARRMSVGLLAFAKLAMWRDLDPDRWPADKSLLSHPLILKLIGGESDESDPPGQLREQYQIDHEDESQAAPEFPLITEADVSQYSAIIDSVSRTSGLVIEGPPGTGKSQTITNLIATFMSQGKSVLFVAEKLAALKVVHKRLEDAGLSSYCMQLHGHNTNKKEVLGGLAKRMTLGAPALEDVRRKREDLKRLKRMLLAHSGKLSVTVGPRAVPLYEAIWLVEALRKRLPPNVDTLASELQQSLIDEPDLDTFLHVKTTLENLGVEWDAIPPEARQAYEGLSPHQYRESMRDAAEHCFSAMTAAADRTAADLEQINAAALPGLLAARFLFKVGKAAENEISSIPVSVPVGFVRRTLTYGRFPELKTLLSTVETFAQAVGSIDKVFDYRGAEIADKVPHAKRIANALITQWCRGDTKLSDLSHVQSQYVQTVTAFQAIPQRAAPIVQLTGTTPRTVDDYNACAGTALELIKGHDALFLYASPNLLREAAKVLLSKALNIRSELDSQRQGLKNTFQITDTLDAGQMDRAAACIENNSGFFAIFNGEYRQAKRFVRGVLSAGTKYSKGPAVVQSLRALAAFTRKRREFNENPDYRGMFGGLFNGLYTDWEAPSAVMTLRRQFSATGKAMSQR